MELKDKVAAFFAQYPVRTYTTGELLLRPEEPVRSIFYILDGHISQYDIAPNGNKVVVNVFKPEAFFPMSAAVNDVENQYFFEADTEVTMYVAPKADVLTFLQENPDALLDLLARVYRGVDGVLRRMAHLMGGGAQSRLMFEILNAAHRFGELQTDESIHIHLTESDLAERSGLTRETVSRLIRNMKSTGLIAVSRGVISIKSVADLEAQLGTNL